MDTDINRSSLEILYSVSRELATTLDLHQVLARVLSLSTENMGAERASLIVMNTNGEPIDAAMIYNGVLSPHTMESMKDMVASGLAGWVIQNKKPALIPNTLRDSRWLIRPDFAVDQGTARSALCVPMMAHEVLVGVLTIVHPQINFFTQEQFHLQRAIADLAGIAIRNAQLYEDIQVAHNRYRDLFEDSIDPIFITEMSGKIIEANKQALEKTGKPESELISIHVSELQEIPPEMAKGKNELVEASSSLTYEAMLKCKECSKIPVEVHVSTINIQSGTYLQWIFRDISERKNLDLLRDDLSAMIYHDLRSPLANIISSLELLRSLLPLNENGSMKQLFEIANRSTERMQRLISSLLDINRLESGQQITDKQYVEIPKMISEAVDTILPNAVSKDVNIEKILLGQMPPVFVDSDMIRRVLINLLENAVKYSPQKNSVFIGAKLNGDQVTFWVEDHGPGIPPESTDRIFNKFVKIQREGVAKGLGLGLAFCRIAVQSHGGKIWVENVSEGGSRFIFTLPAAV